MHIINNEVICIVKNAETYNNVYTFLKNYDIIGGIEVIEVKLSSLTIKGLYGAYDYNVKFNSDVTFIFGSNGCGKTTVLNITEAIITGCLYKLFEYEFKKIVLHYNDQGDDCFISIVYKDKNAINTTFMNKEYTIERVDDFAEESRFSDERNVKLREQYFNRFMVLESIHKIFNYVYLPLNRSLTYEYSNYDYRMLRRTGLYQYGQLIRNVNPDRRDKALYQVQALVYEKVSRVNNIISKINDRFRNEILKYSLDFDSGDDIDKLFNELKIYSKESIKSIEKSYIKMLTDLNIINEDEKNKYINYFSGIINDMESTADEKNSYMASLVLRYKDIMRIKKFCSIAESAEKKKASARTDIELFLNTINSFITSNEEQKEIVITNDGEIGFKTKYRKELLSIHLLSSGEKQLLIFFANLIFNVGKNKNGIFVVDEPELSLHLSWQKIFVEKTMQINPNIQLIFATHSPELVGKYRDKMFRLEKRMNN